MTIALSILAGLLLLIGFVGCVVPILPGLIIVDWGGSGMNSTVGNDTLVPEHGH